MSEDSLLYLTKYFYKKPEEIKKKEILLLRSFFIENITSSINSNSIQDLKFNI